MAPRIGTDQRQRGGLPVSHKGPVGRSDAVARLREDTPQAGRGVVFQIEQYDIPHGRHACVTHNEDVAIVDEGRHEVTTNEDELADEEPQEQEQEQGDAEGRTKDKAPRELQARGGSD
jgi:hypothetical protein